jgi:hypothetical protein
MSGSTQGNTERSNDFGLREKEILKAKFDPSRPGWEGRIWDGG